MYLANTLSHPTNNTFAPTMPTDICQLHTSVTSAAPVFGTVDTLANDIYVIGKLMADFPSEGIKEEFRRCYCVSKDSSTDPFLPPNYLTKEPDIRSEKKREAAEQAMIKEVLAIPANRYLARELDWKLKDQFHNTLYFLQPSEYNLSLLISQLEDDVLVVGQARPDSHYDVPLLVIDKVTAQTHITDQRNNNRDSAMSQLREDLYPVTKNAGNTDAERAINYLFYNDPETAKQYQKICGDRASHSSQLRARLQQIHTLPLQSGDRLIIQIIFDFHDFQANLIKQWMAAVDVTDLFPFKVHTLSPYLPIYS